VFLLSLLVELEEVKNGMGDWDEWCWSTSWSPLSFCIPIGNRCSIPHCWYGWCWSTNWSPLSFCISIGNRYTIPCCWHGYLGNLIMKGNIELTHKTFFLYCTPLFIVCVVIALLADIIFYFGINKITSFNMFYISPFKDSISLSSLSWERKSTPFFCFCFLFLLYFLGI
jgi:hypothetical protein